VERPVDRRNDALLAGLAAQAGELSNAARDLADTVKLNRFARWFVVLVSFIMLAGMTISVWGAFETRNNTNRIISCTEVNGKCYQHNKQSSDSTVQSINDVIVAAAYCAKLPENQTLKEVTDCTRKSIGSPK